MIVIDRVKTLMKNHNIKSFAECERACELSNGTFRKWELGEYKPSMTALKKISNYFDVPVDYLLGESCTNDLSVYDVLDKHLREKFAVTDDDSSAGQLLNTLNASTIKIVVEAFQEWEEIKKTTDK